MNISTFNLAVLSTIDKNFKNLLRLKKKRFQGSKINVSFLAICVHIPTFKIFKLMDFNPSIYFVLMNYS